MFRSFRHSDLFRISDFVLRIFSVIVPTDSGTRGPTQFKEDDMLESLFRPKAVAVIGAVLLAKKRVRT